MNKDFLIFLKHILESIELIEDYVKDTNEKNFWVIHSNKMQSFEELRSSEKQ